MKSYGGHEWEDLLARKLLDIDSKCFTLSTFVIQKYGKKTYERLKAVQETGFWDSHTAWQFIVGEKEEYGHNG